MGRFTAFIIGAAAGAAASLLLTPRNGAENRALLNQTVSENCKCPISPQTQRKAKKKADQLIDAAATTSTKVINTVIDNGSDAYKAAASRIQQITPPSAASFNNNGDELREKIDAARERIATQVAKNAEAARDAAVDAIPAAVDAAKGATDAAKGAVSAAKDTVASATASVAAKISPNAETPADATATEDPAPAEKTEE